MSNNSNAFGGFEAVPRSRGVISVVRGNKGDKTGAVKPQHSEPIDVDALYDQMDGIEDNENPSCDEVPLPTCGISTKADSKQKFVRTEQQRYLANEHVNELQLQVDDIYKGQYTVPEQLLERTEAQHQSQIQAHNVVDHVLETRVMQHDSFARKGKTVVYELLTRDEAEKEIATLRRQIKNYKEALIDKDKIIKEKNQEIDSLHQEQKALRIELKTVVDTNRGLVDKIQCQTSRSTPHIRSPAPIVSSIQDPKMTQIIRLYEDMSKIAILDMKRVRARYLGAEEWYLNCCYTHNDVTDRAVPLSLLFSMRLCWDPKSGETDPILDESQLVESVHYLPKDLHKKSPEFVQSLGFLKNNFTFERNQLSFFVRTLYDYISGEEIDDASRNDDASGSESSVIMIE